MTIHGHRTKRPEGANLPAYRAGASSLVAQEYIGRRDARILHVRQTGVRVCVQKTDLHKFQPRFGISCARPSGFVLSVCLKERFGSVWRALAGFGGGEWWVRSAVFVWWGGKANGQGAKDANGARCGGFVLQKLRKDGASWCAAGRGPRQPQWMATSWTSSRGLPCLSLGGSNHHCQRAR
jgi:hypothetical protein